MDEEEANELMRFIISRLRDAGMQELVERVTVDTGEIDAPPSMHLMRMLEFLDAEIRPHAYETAERIMVQFQEIVRTPNGGPPRGLRLDLVGAHSDLFRADSVDLRGARLGDVLAELDELRAALGEEFGRGRFA